MCLLCLCECTSCVIMGIFIPGVHTGLNLQISLVSLVLLNYWKFSQHIFFICGKEKHFKCEKAIMQLQEVAIRAWNSETLEANTKNQKKPWLDFKLLALPDLLRTGKVLLIYAWIMCILGCFNYYISELSQEYKHPLLPLSKVRDTKAEITYKC